MHRTVPDGRAVIDSRMPLGVGVLENNPTLTCRERRELTDTDTT